MVYSTQSRFDLIARDSRYTERRCARNTSNRAYLVVAAPTLRRTRGRLREAALSRATAEVPQSSTPRTEPTQAVGLFGDATKRGQESTELPSVGHGGSEVPESREMAPSSSRCLR